MSEGPSPPLDRLVAVLERFASKGDWGVREMAGATGISSTAAHRLLHDMERLGLLGPGDERGRFVIGPELARLAVLLAGRIELRTVARPILEEASQRIDETVVLTSYVPARRAFWAVDAVEASHPIGYVWESLRTWSDLVRGASGKGILAFLPADEQEVILSSVDGPARDRLRVDLEETRRRGYALSHGERFAGAVGVAAPVRDATGSVVGDVVAGWPDNRNDRRKERDVALVITDAATRLSQRLGYRVAGGATRRPSKASATEASRNVVEDRQAES